MSPVATLISCGQLVERQAPQHLADGGDPCGVGEDRVVAGDHGAELPDQERAAGHADALLAEEHRPRRAEPDGQRADRAQDRGGHGDDRQHRQVERSLAPVRSVHSDAPVPGPLWVGRRRSPMGSAGIVGAGRSGTVTSWGASTCHRRTWRAPNASGCSPRSTPTGSPPLGPEVDGFEADVAAFCGAEAAVALSSGTAALHLALLLLGVGPSDEVWVSTLTFVAPANAVRYVGAGLRFVDSEAQTWNMDPDLLAEALERAAAADRLPAAVVVVDIYGQCAQLDRIWRCATGTACRWSRTRRRRWAPPGRAGRAGTLGPVRGVLVQREQDHHHRRRRDAGGRPGVHGPGPLPGHAGPRAGAALRAHRGRVQLPPVQPVSPPSGGASWRTCRPRSTAATTSTGATARAWPTWPASRSCPGTTGAAPTAGSRSWSSTPTSWRRHPTSCARRWTRADIEARPAWKPMHLQPLFADVACEGGEVAARPVPPGRVPAERVGAHRRGRGPRGGRGARRAGLTSVRVTRR